MGFMTQAWPLIQRRVNAGRLGVVFRKAAGLMRPRFGLAFAIVLAGSMERWMQVYIFRGPGRVFGFTQDERGANLPSRYAPWTHFKTVEMNKGVPTPGGVSTDECLDDIERYGYHLTDAHVRITEQTEA